MTQTKTIPMKAFGKARPRVTRNGTFMPPDYERQRTQLKMLFGPVEVEGLVRLSVTAVRKLPKKTDKAPGDHCTHGPDVDNIAGAVMDSLFPEDDSVVISVYCEKIWGLEDSMIIRLYGVEPDNGVRRNFSDLSQQIIAEREGLWVKMALGDTRTEAEAAADFDAMEDME
jgi:Holliday junction resolvase RusA-like endonuclease